MTLIKQSAYDQNKMEVNARSPVRPLSLDLELQRYIFLVALEMTEEKFVVLVEDSFFVKAEFL